MRLSRAVEEFLQERQMEGSLLTYKAYKSDLLLLVALATNELGDNVSAFTPDLVRLYFRKKEARGLGAEARIRSRSALSEFGKWALRRRLILVNPMVEAAPRIKRPKRVPRPFTLEERARLLALELTPEEATLRSLLYYAGLRVSEVAGLRWRSVRLSSAEQRGALRIVGKGNKERVVPMLRELDAALRAWITAPLVQRTLGPTRKALRLVDHRVAQRRRGAGAVAGQEALLHGAGGVAVPVPVGRFDVEVLARCAHGSQVEGQPRPDLVPRRGDVVRDRQRQHGADVDVLQCATRAFRPPRDQFELLGIEHERQPAVGDGAGLLDRARADGAEVDRDALLHRARQQLQRPAEPLGQPQRPLLAGVLERPLAGQRRAHDLHVLARAHERTGEGHAVPALGDLRTGHAQPEPEATAAHDVQRRRGHRGGGGLARGDLEQARAQRDALGPARQQPEHRDRVLTPRLGHPHRVHPQVVGDDRELDLLVERQPGPVGEVEADVHRAFEATAPSGRPRTG